MKKIIISIGTGLLSDQQIRSFQKMLLRHYQAHIDLKSVRVLWNQLPISNIYHDYQNEPQTVITIEGPADLSQQRRVAMFEACTQDWLLLTGQRADQLVISILPQPIFATLSQMNNQQLSLGGKARSFLRIALSLLTSRISKGYYAFHSSSKHR